jgi:nitrous oxide reductase accessory protein NosL
MLEQKWVVALKVTIVILVAVLLSGCTENNVETEELIDTLEDADVDSFSIEEHYGDSGETIIVPDGIQVTEWKIAVDRILVTLENTETSGIYINKISADISFDDDMSTFRHYEASMNGELGPGEVKIISIRIHRFSDWEKPSLKSIEVS